MPIEVNRVNKECPRCKEPTTFSDGKKRICRRCWWESKPEDKKQSSLEFIGWLPKMKFIEQIPRKALVNILNDGEEILNELDIGRAEEETEEGIVAICDSVDSSRDSGSSIIT